MLLTISWTKFLFLARKILAVSKSEGRWRKVSRAVATYTERERQKVKRAERRVVRTSKKEGYKKKNVSVTAMRSGRAGKGAARSRSRAPTPSFPSLPSFLPRPRRVPRSNPSPPSGTASRRDSYTSFARPGCGSGGRYKTSTCSLIPVWIEIVTLVGMGDTKLSMFFFD